jgi:hypothetical protein
MHLRINTIKKCCCEIKFSIEIYRHSPTDWNTETSYFMCNNWDRRNFLVALNLQIDVSASM